MSARSNILERLRDSTLINDFNISKCSSPDLTNGCNNKSPIDDRIERFIEQARNSGAKLTSLCSRGELAGEITRYLHKKKLPFRLQVSNESLSYLKSSSSLQIEEGLFTDDNGVGLVEAYAGIAETGTLVSLSSHTLSTASLYLPRVSIFVLEASSIVEHLEDAWPVVRAKRSGLPRTVNLITGPSRTGDIEQTIQIGAHGPCEMHIFLVNCAHQTDMGNFSGGKKDEENGSGR